MDSRIFPSRLSGTVSAPGSKSLGQRACALALLHKGKTHVFHLGKSADDRVALNIIRKMGAVVTGGDGVLQIESSGEPLPVDQIDCGESGLSFRMFGAVVALLDQPVLITGSGSLVNRPMHFMEEYFPLFSVTVESNAGKLPLTITGPLIPADAVLPGHESSQYISGLLIALARQAKERVTLTVTNAGSKPYLDLTVSMMRQFGYEIRHQNHEVFIIEPVSDFSPEVTINIEGDWSAAAFLLVAGAIAGAVTVNNLETESLQGDRSIIDVLKSAGADIIINKNDISISPPEHLSAFAFDATNTPDLFPPLAVLAMYARGASRIKGVHRLVTKESNRSKAIADLCGQMGVGFSIEDDEMIITGGKVNGAILSSHNDHRMVMAAAIAALNAEGVSFISGAEAVAKSYPLFFDALQNLGARIELSGKLQYE